MTEELLVYLADHLAGRLKRVRHGRVEFEYDQQWQSHPDAYPLSLSMPLAARNHSAKVVEPYLWGLLPDNDVIVEAWARRFQVSARSAFALLREVGEDCPGAVRLLRPERARQKPTSGGVEWLRARDVAERLRALRTDISAWRVPADTGQFSLAGAQPKTALWFDGRRWGVPHGSTPTTHILKPGVLDLDGSAHNEHFCLELGRELALPVARSRIVWFEDEVAIVIERYDRATVAGSVVRVHQEDVCQALAVHPSAKYENQGGPGAPAAARLLRDVSSEPRADVELLVSALAFNWLIGGTDAHAKNYSLLIGAGGRARLAPLYDLASALPYPDLSPQKLKLAMKIGGKYRLRDIGTHQWRKLAAELALDPDALVAAVHTLANRVLDASSSVRSRTREEGLEHPIIDRLHEAVCKHAKRCAALISGKAR